MYPPHLPPPTSNLARHRQWQRIKVVLASTFFGIIAGITGAAIMLGWIWPVTSDSDGWLLTRNRTVFTREQLQQRAEIKIADKIFSIYRASTTIGKAKYFSEKDKIADGVVGVSSGWIISYIPNYDGRTKEWIVVAQNGTLFSVEKGMIDKKTGVVFLKLAPTSDQTERFDEQFKVVTFNSDVGTFDDVFIYQENKWLNSAVTGRVPASDESHLDAVPPLAYGLSDNFENGSVAIDSQGNVIGFVVNKTLIPLHNMNYFLNGIDNKKQLTYPSLGIEGWYSSEKLLLIDEKKTEGFIINRVVGNRNVFQKGDIVLEINGRPALWENVWNIQDSDKIRVTVWRAGKTINNEVPILQI